MIRATTCLLFAGGLMLILLGTASTANSGTGPIRVTATLALSSTQPRAPAGRRGDVVEQSWRVNGRQGTRIGRMLLACRWVLRRARLCNGELQMPLGTIQVQGSSSSKFSGEYAVTGGTGLYAGVYGTMTYTAIGARKTLLLLTIAT